jgi:hypothetical protein
MVTGNLCSLAGPKRQSWDCRFGPAPGYLFKVIMIRYTWSGKHGQDQSGQGQQGQQGQANMVR